MSGCTFSYQRIVESDDGSITTPNRVLPPCPEDAATKRLRVRGVGGGVVHVRLFELERDQRGATTTMGCVNLKDLSELVREQVQSKGYNNWDKAYFKVFRDEKSAEASGELLPYEEAYKEFASAGSVEFYSDEGQRSEMPYSFEMSGRNEVRVRNPNEYGATVMLRMGKKGRNFYVPPRRTESVYVPDGYYEIYFQYSNEPSGLYQGDSFTLTGNGVEIQMVQAIVGNYGIRRVR